MPSRQLQVVPWYSGTGNPEGERPSDDLSSRLRLQRPARTSLRCSRRAPLSALAPREQEVCRYFLLGLSSEAISQTLGISLHSTRTYRKRAYERLGISSQNELLAIVLRLFRGLIA